MNDQVIFGALTAAVAALFSFTVLIVKMTIAREQERGDACCGQRDRLYEEAKAQNEATRAKNDADLERFRSGRSGAAGKYP